MKKLVVAVLVVLAATGIFAGVAAAQSTAQVQTGYLHDYMEEALAAKLNLSVETVESEFDAGKTMAQIALENGITQDNLYAFMLEVRTQAVQAALADGVLTQAQADRMLQMGGRMMGYGRVNGGGGYGMMNGGTGTGPCGGTGIPVGGGMMQRGGRFGQSNP